MIGAIAGDIIGSPYEWDRIKTTKFELFKNFGDYVCCMTDDSVLTIATAAAILENKEEPDYGKWYKKFAKKYPGAGYGNSFCRWVDTDGVTNNSYGNGSAMRVSPVGWAYSGIKNVRSEAHRSAATSHNSPSGIKGAQATAETIYLLRAYHDKETTRMVIADEYGYDMDEPLDSVRTWYEFDETCAGTVPYAFRCVYEAKSYIEAVRLAVSLGGDSDTLACIAGAMAEAMWGVPNEVVEKTVEIMNENYPSLIDYVIPFLSLYVEKE